MELASQMSWHAAGGDFEIKGGIPWFTPKTRFSNDDMKAFFASDLPDLRRRLETRAAPQPYRMLVDVRHLSSLSPAARRTAYAHVGDSLDFRFALLGQSAFHRILMKFMIMVTRAKHARYFADAAAACAWLDGAEEPMDE